jgi:hypothetical protein
MNPKLGQQQILVLVFLTIMFGGASLLELGSGDTVPINPIFLKLRYLLIMVGLGGSFLLNIKDKENSHSWKFNCQYSPLLKIWILFCVLIEISGCINYDVTSIRDGYWLLIGVPLFFFNIIPKVLKGTGHIVIPLAITISHLPYLIASLALKPPGSVDQTFYSGVLGNSNQLGFISAVTASGVLILLIGSLCAKKNVILIGFLTFLLVIIMSILFVAFARTSIITLLLMLLISTILFFSRQPKSLVKVSFFLSLVVTIILLQLDKFIKYLSYDLGINFSDLLQKKEGLSGREEIWLRTIHELTFWGHGSTYYDSFGIGPHNTVIKALGVYGLMSMFATILLAITSLFFALAYSKAHFKTNFYAVTPLIITVCFWTLSIGEDMFGSLGKGITLAYFATMGIMMTEFNSQALSQHLSTTQKKIVNKSITLLKKN